MKTRAKKYLEKDVEKLQQLNLKTISIPKKTNNVENRQYLDQLISQENMGNSIILGNSINQSSSKQLGYNFDVNRCRQPTPSQHNRALRNSMDSLKQKYDESHQQLDLKAKEFIKLVSKQRRQLLGSKVYRKQNEEKRRKLKTQMESYQKNIIWNHYRQKRRSLAQMNIKIFEQKTKIRKELRKKQEKLTNSPQMFRKSTEKKSNQSHGRYRTLSLANGSRRGEDRKKLTHSFQIASNQIYLNKQQRYVQSTRKMIVKLQRLLEKQSLLQSYV